MFEIMLININKFNLFNHVAANNRQPVSRYPNLGPLPKDTVSFSGRGKLLSENMVDAPTERTCKQAEINAEPARYYLELVLDKYVKPLKQINSDSDSKKFPVLEYTTRTKKSTSIREKVISKYSKIYSMEANEFASRVVSELLKYFKLKNGITREQILLEAKKCLAKAVPPREFSSYYFYSIVSELEKKNRLTFSDYSDEKKKQIFSKIADSLEDIPKSPHCEGSVYIQPTSINGVKHYANDIIGARITMKESDPKYTGFVLAALKQAVTDGVLKITSIENNLPDPKKLPDGTNISDYAYANDSQLRPLAKAADAELIRNKSQSGYMAIHINVDLSNPIFSCYNGVFDGYSGEIQIIGSDVEQLKDVEDLCYKLKDDKNAIRAEYKPFKTHFKTYYNDETKDAFEAYTYALYLAQRRIPPHTKREKTFLTIEDLGFGGLVPKELDFNLLKTLKEKCERNAKLIQRQEQGKDKSSAANNQSEKIKTLKQSGNIKTVKSLISYVLKN